MRISQHDMVGPLSGTSPMQTLDVLFLLYNTIQQIQVAAWLYT